MNRDWEMPFRRAKWEFQDAAPPGDQIPGLLEKKGAA